MTKLTRQDLEAFAAHPAVEPPEWIRVQFDTGGIAAGAAQVHRALQAALAERPLSVVLRRAGSTGYSFADPVIEIQSAGMPRVHYGRVTPEMAPQILDEHVAARRLLDDHVIATRQRKLALDGPVTHVLVRDTGTNNGSKTEFFQFSFREEDVELLT